MTRGEGFDWYILIDGAPCGPVSAQDLARFAVERRLAAGDLVWCEGLANWMPVGAVLGASERPAPRSPTHTVWVDAAERRQAAGRVVSLSRLYVEKLAEQAHASVPLPSSSGIVEAHDASGAYADAYHAAASNWHAPQYAGARYLPRDRQAADPWQPEPVRLV